MLKVLIADDEEIIRTSLSTMIPWSELGCLVVAVARNGIEAYQQASDYYPDIIITDVMMPIMDGLELIKKVRLIDDDVEFIVLSGYGEFSFAQKAMQYGVKHYLLKPTKKTDLIDILKTIIKGIQEKEEKHKEEYINLIKEFSFNFQKGVMLELLNTPNSVKVILERNMKVLGLQGVENACLLGLGVGISRYRSSVIEMLNYLKIHKTEILIAPVEGNGIIYYILHIENIVAVDTFRQYVNSCGNTIQVFQVDSISSIFSHLIRCIGTCKEIQIFDATGRSEYLSNENGFARRIVALGTDVAKYVKEGNDGVSVMDELNKVLSGCSLDEAKSVLLNLAITLHNSEEDMASGQVLSIIRKVNSVDEIQTCIKHLVQHQLSTAIEGGSYPIRVIKKYIEQNLSSESISLKWIAENLLYMNVGYLSKLFIKEVGVKFSDYINRMRIHSAKQLMTVYHKSMIQEIAQEVGFGNNPRYFSQVFRKYEGITPTDYVLTIKEQKKDDATHDT